MRILAVTNMYPTSTDAASGTFVEQQVTGLRGLGLEVDLLFVNRRHASPFVYRTIGNRMRSSLQRFDADIVHVMYGGVMADLATKAVRDRPTVVTFHGSDLLGARSSGYVKRAMAYYGVRSSLAAAQRATGIVVVAKALQQCLPTRVNHSKVRVIPCGIDLTRFKPMDQSECRQRIGWQKDGFHVLFNSNGDDPVKRPQLARAAMATLIRMGVRAEIHELRNLPNNEVPEWLNASDVLLLTSAHEGSPTVVKEALACNVPLVSVDVGDVKERIRDIEGCYLASPDPDDLAAKLRLVYAGPRRVQARSTIEELSVKRTASQLRDFYESLRPPCSNAPKIQRYT
jgi:glycosyltransferase involved in cell wall biosynthesis